VKRILALAALHAAKVVSFIYHCPAINGGA